MKCACVFEDREQPDFSGRHPVLLEECGYHACLRRDGDYIKHDVGHAWHVAINQFTNGKVGATDWPHFMYEGKTLAYEVPRMIRVLRQEREGKLEKIHRQCSMSSPEQIEDNHLSCCLGIECRKCPHLLALEKAEMTHEQIDVAKAWTCAAHILSSGRGVDTSECYLLTVGDRMYWSRLYESLSDSGTDGDLKSRE